MAGDHSDDPRAAGTDVEAVTGAVVTASRVLVAVAARSLAAVQDAVTLPQFRLMVVLDTRGDLKLAGVADHLAVNPSTALRMVERLEAAGMVSRAVNPAIRREVIVSLTDAGRRVVDDVTARRRAEIATIVTRLEPAERTRLVGALRAFAVAGDEPSVDPAPGEPALLGWS
jgi:DNA-binding MarR family transcriptional regulator